MVIISTTAKSAIFYSIIGIVAGIGIMVLVFGNQTFQQVFLSLTGQSSDNNPAFAIREKHMARLAVGEEGIFNSSASGGKQPYKFEWKFSDGQTLTGKSITRSFDVPGAHYFDVTATDADGKQVKTTNLSIDILQELPNVNETANTTSMQHQN
jgi:hypothetical protein